MKYLKKNQLVLRGWNSRNCSFTFFSIGASACEAFAAVYMQLAILPVLLIIIIDRICIWKCGIQKVNKIEFSVAGILIGLFLLNWLRLQLQN